MHPSTGPLTNRRQAQPSPATALGILDYATEEPLEFYSERFQPGDNFSGSRYGRLRGWRFFTGAVS